MSDNKQIVIPEGFGSKGVSPVFQNIPASNDLAEGIRGGFGIVGFKGKTWSIKYQGNETILMRDDKNDPGPRSSIEVVIVKSSKSISKIYYVNGYVDGSTAPPDCWSTNGVNPDPASPKKQSNTCAGCPQNAWGSKVTEAGKQTKACGDSKRIAVTPLNDLRNEVMGGPLLLRIPAATLKDLKLYGDTLQSYGYPYFAVATRISFDVNEAYPKFIFGPLRPLTDDEARIIVELQDSPQVTTMLNESVDIVHHEPVQALPSTPFEQPQTAAPAAGAAKVTAPAAQPVQPVANPPAEATQTAAPAEPVKRTRRTKAEMEAATAALKASREGKTTPGAVQPTDPAHAQAGAAQEQASAAAPADFENLLENLLK